MLGTKLAAAMVTLVEEDDLVAGAELGHQQADDRRHAAGEEHGFFRPFQGGQLPLGDALAGVAVAAVFLARLLLFDVVDHRLRVGERVGRGAEDRIGDRVARLLAGLAAVDAERREVRSRALGRWWRGRRRLRGRPIWRGFGHFRSTHGESRARRLPGPSSIFSRRSIKKAAGPIARNRGCWLTVVRKNVRPALFVEGTAHDVNSLADGSLAVSAASGHKSQVLSILHRRASPAQARSPDDGGVFYCLGRFPVEFRPAVAVGATVLAGAVVIQSPSAVGYLLVGWRIMDASQQSAVRGMIRSRFRILATILLLSAAACVSFGARVAAAANAFDRRCRTMDPRAWRR